MVMFLFDNLEKVMNIATMSLASLMVASAASHVVASFEMTSAPEEAPVLTQEKMTIAHVETPDRASPDQCESTSNDKPKKG
jgi:hypothetical protein